MLSEDMAEAAGREYPILDKIYEDQTVIRVSGKRVEFDSVKFVRCRMEECDFSGASFCNVIFDKCDFSNCSFRDTYWKNVNISDSKGDGSQFCNSTFKWVKLLDSQFHYGNFSTAFWEFGEIRGCNFRESFMSEVKFKKTVFSSTDLAGTDFFRTPLKGMDLSECVIDGIMVSDQFTELAGVKVSLLQAAELARLMGVKIV